MVTTRKVMKKLIVFLPLLLFAGSVKISVIVAQTTFGPQQVIIEPEVRNVQAVYAADLDNDGDLDVMSASSGDDKIAWYENDGNGYFGEQQVITINANEASSVFAADLDNDSDLDVLSASRNDDKIAWYENDGNGYFGEQQIITTNADEAFFIFAADLDNDGDLDVLSASSGDDKIAWYENDGSAGFGVQQVIAAFLDGPYPFSVYVADLDGDGNLDVLTASYDDNKLAWYKNDGAGNFGTQRLVASDISEPKCIYATDFDNDGDLDVLTNSGNGFTAGQFIWFQNDGSGNFGPQQEIGDSAYPPPFQVNAADLDNDGDLDVLTASIDLFAGYCEIGWFENEGAGNFGDLQILATGGGGPPFVTAADLDIDGDLDILWSGDHNQIAWFENISNGIFEAEHIITAIANDATCVYAADMDNDGDMDVLSAYAAGVNIAWYENDGNGHFGTQNVISTDAEGAGTVYAADLDNDGDLDVLSSSWGDNKIAWYENNGAGNFGPQNIISTDDFPKVSVYAADLDNDGDLDVLTASSYYPDYEEVAWYENIGNAASWVHHGITTNISGATSVRAADLDNDGDQDVLSASWNDNEIAWYKNNLSSGYFWSQLIITTNTDGVNAVYVADMDNDDDMDVLSASYNDNKIAWYKNDGNGNFGQFIAVNADHAVDVYAADLDNDDDMDVLAASYNDKITWYENDGNGNLGAKQIITSDVGYAESVYAADLDNDGDLDVLSASAYDGKIAWYENLLGSVGVEDIQTKSKLFTLYPNPSGSSTYIQIEPSAIQGQTLDLRIVNAQGELVLANAEITANGSLLTLPQASAGVYYVTLSTGKTSQTLRWVVLPEW
jgi:hypothetical protein